MAGDPSDDPDDLRSSLEHHLAYRLARNVEDATPHDLYLALAHAVRERVMDRWLATRRVHREGNVREVGYLSMEFHVGRLLRTALQALELEGGSREALETISAKLEDLEGQEPDPNLGSGGLGRLAACFLDSLATQDLPAWGYGLRYELGLVKQVIRNGQQTEEPDPWLNDGQNPWEVHQPAETVTVSFGGTVRSRHSDHGVRFEWTPAEQVRAVPYDLPVPGYGTGTVNTLRLWSARPPRTSDLDLAAFARGEYPEAWGARIRARAINAFLYPTDVTRAGKVLRLRQQFFLASATLQDVLRRHLRSNPLETLADRVVLQLNDTHPAIAIPELMRILMDDHHVAWDEAWGLVRRIFAYTNHTLLPEALETWSPELIQELLPRQMQIVREIDRRFREEARRAFPDDAPRVSRMAVVEPGAGGRIRMAHLAVVGSSSVNGVAALHTELLKAGLMRDLYELYPERFNSKTNGITPRRWLKLANPGLAALVTERVGPGWERDLQRLRALVDQSDDPDLQRAFRAVKLENKRALAALIQRETGVKVDPASLFDVQIKRIHEYKRQLLLVMWTVSRYLALRDGALSDPVPRTVIFSGKAAPSYAVAKLIVHLIHAVAAVVNADPRTRDQLRVVFLPNYRVSLAEAIIPAADLSEQISTAGYEASGTGNMKLALNGALTIGTLDGANVEIRDEVGEENIFIFGLEAHQVRELRERGYRPRRHYEEDGRLRAVVDTIASHAFPPGFYSLMQNLLNDDPYMLLADFGGYLETQERVDRTWRDTAAWDRMAIQNTARVGKFSSDRTIAEYAREIWHLDPVPVPTCSRTGVGENQG